MLAFDLVGVQPMTGPTGLIFAMKSRYSTQGGTEALFNEADTGFSGAASGDTGSADAGNNDPFAGDDPASGGSVGTDSDTVDEYNLVLVTLLLMLKHKFLLLISLRWRFQSIRLL